jgi:hypothetical protein
LEKKEISELPSKNKVAIENLPLWTSFFLLATLFSEGNKTK